jgi:phosphohistidine phosphatase
MKTLLIFRHGKAEERAPGGDKDRALTPRGERDVARVAGHLAAQAGMPDRIVTSDARRAQHTATIVAETIGFPGTVQPEPRLYGAGEDTLVTIVHELSDEADAVVLVGHNPGFELLGNLLVAADTPIPELPTAGLIHLEFDVTHWHDVQRGTGRLRGVYTPRQPAEEDA